MQFMLDKKTSILDMAPKRPDTMADTVIAKCVQKMYLNALIPWFCLAQTSYRCMNEK